MTSNDLVLLCEMNFQILLGGPFWALLQLQSIILLMQFVIWSFIIYLPKALWGIMTHVENSSLDWLPVLWL